MRSLVVWGVMMGSIVGLAETVPAAPTRVYYPSQPQQQPPAGTVQGGDESVFVLPEDKLNQPSKIEYQYIGGRPAADPSPLYRGRSEEFEKACAEYRDKGQMELFRRCYKDKRDAAVAEVQGAFDRTSKTTETPLRKSDSSNPVIDEQRRANQAFEAEENN